MKLNVLPAATGAQWVRLGIRTFFRRPIALAGLFFMFMAALSLLAVVPLIGGVLALVLVPALTVGLMAAARAADAGNFPLPGILFVAFHQGREQTRAILILGGVYAVAVLLVVGLTALIDGGRFAQLYMGGGSMSNELINDPGFITALWVSTLLYLPVSLAFWHAPALVHWHRLPPLKSLFFSAVAVLRNARAFLVYGLLWMGLSLGVGLFLMLVLAMTAMSTDIGVATAALFPLSVIIAAMFFTSLWFTFRDSFTADDEPLIEIPEP